MHKSSGYHPLLLLFLTLLPVLRASAQTFRDPTGFGCSMCQVLDNPQELIPCSVPWRELMTVCALPECSSYAKYVSKSPPVSSCTNTPDPLPGGPASAGFSFGTWITPSRGPATGTSVFSSVRRSVEGSGGGATATATTSGGGLVPTGGGGRNNATAGGVNSTATGNLRTLVDQPTAIVESTGTGTGTNSGIATATGGVGRLVAGSLGVGWLWEVVFLFWGAVW